MAAVILPAFPVFPETSRTGSPGFPELPAPPLGGGKNGKDRRDGWADSPRVSGNPFMTPEQGDDCHAGGWTAAEIDAFVIRRDRFTAAGRSDADHLAERLTLRDRQGDERRLCLECAALRPRGCAAAQRGEVPGAGPQFVPMLDVLQRCPAFIPTLEITQ